MGPAAWEQVGRCRRVHRLTIGSSDRGEGSLGEPKRRSMIGIKQLGLSSAHPRVARPHL